MTEQGSPKSRSSVLRCTEMWLMKHWRHRNGIHRRSPARPEIQTRKPVTASGISETASEMGGDGERERKGQDQQRI